MQNADPSIRQTFQEMRLAARMPGQFRAQQAMRLTAAWDAQITPHRPPARPVMQAPTAVTAYLILTASATGNAVMNDTGKAARLKTGRIFLLVLVWLIMLGAPAVEAMLPPNLQTMTTNEYATVSLAIALTTVIISNRKP